MKSISKFEAIKSILTENALSPSSGEAFAVVEEFIFFWKADSLDVVSKVKGSVKDKQSIIVE